jgi:Tim10/DDP family zinc finger
MDLTGLSSNQKSDLMDQVKQQIALANAQELLTKMTQKCFSKVNLINFYSGRDKTKLSRFFSVLPDPELNLIPRNRSALRCAWIGKLKF